MYPPEGRIVAVCVVSVDGRADDDNDDDDDVVVAEEEEEDEERRDIARDLPLTFVMASTAKTARCSPAAPPTLVITAARARPSRTSLSRINVSLSRLKDDEEEERGVGIVEETYLEKDRDMEERTEGTITEEMRERASRTTCG
jgi:hypothetical protein